MLRQLNNCEREQSRGRQLQRPPAPTDGRSYSSVSKNSRIMQVNSNSHYFKNDGQHEHSHQHKRQKSAVDSLLRNYEGKSTINGVYMTVGQPSRKTNDMDATHQMDA